MPANKIKKEKANSGGMACKKCGAMSCSCGGMAKKYNKGGMVLEIGLRPATKSEMKMAKAVKKADGGMVRGTGAAITGKGFKGVF